MNSTPSKTFYTFQNIIDQVDIILEQIKHKNFDAVIDNENMVLAEQNKVLYETLATFGWVDMSVLQED